MCVVSMVLDYGIKTWPEPNINPNPLPNWPVPLPNTQPNIIPNAPFDWSEFVEQFKKYNVTLQAAKEFDKAAKQPDCEDPKKVEWAKNLCDRLTQIGKELIQGCGEEDFGVELIEIAKDMREILEL